MRVVWLVLASSVAFASPQKKPVRKPAPVDLPADRLSYFADAVIADKAGDLDTAVNRYRSALSGDKEHAAIVYNIADLDRRREKYEDAIKGYKKYLELAPDAKDRAAVQKLIDDIAKTPMTIVIDGEDLDAVVFVDGKPAGPSPVVMSLPDGEHVIDRIGPASYKHDYVTARPMAQQHVTAYSNERAGNVVLATSARYSGSWRDREIEYRMNDRFTLPPGRYDTYFFEPGRACSPLSFQVPADGLVYVFVDAPRERSANCVPIKVTAQKIQFPKAKP